MEENQHNQSPYYNIILTYGSFTISGKKMGLVLCVQYYIQKTEEIKNSNRKRW